MCPLVNSVKQVFRELHSPSSYNKSYMDIQYVKQVKVEFSDEGRIIRLKDIQFPPHII